MVASEALKRLRHRLGISMREVEESSRRLADREGNPEFYISNAWLSQIENSQSTPSIYKLYSLSTIYHTKYTDMLLLFGIDLNKLSADQSKTPLRNTHPTELEVYDNDRLVSFPVQFDPSFKPEKTTLLSRIIETWGEIPIALIQYLDLRKHKYGYIGLKDYTLYPMIRPGSFVQIDDRHDSISASPWRSEFDRPIYFIELRDGYACSWCELQGKNLMLIPHPLSPARVRQFNYPQEAEVVGRVTAAAIRLIDSQSTTSSEPAALPVRT